MIDPSRHGVFIPPDFVGVEVASVAVVSQGNHSFAGPFLRPLPAVQHRGFDGFVAIGEDVRFNCYDISNNFLNWIAGGLGLGSYALYHCTAAPFGRSLWYSHG